MSLRGGFGLVIPAAALIIYLLLRTPGRLGDLLSMVATASLFAMPIAGLWASGQTQSIAINGLIPLADAANYYTDGLRILAGMDISHFSAMRPFFAGFLSLLLYISERNFMVSLAIIGMLNAFAVYLTAREFQRTHGAEVATFILIFLFLYFRAHSGTSMSETLGMMLGALGMALIWRSVGKNSEALVIFGIFTLAFALNVRPGAMFILPILLIWASWIFKKENKWISYKVFVGGLCAIILSFSLNFTYIKLLAEPSGTAFSNFSWALYGLASGGNSYKYVFQVHPELLQVQDPQQSQTIYRLAIDLIIHNPGLILKGSSYYWSTFFSGSWYNAYSFVSGENYLINTIARWVLYILGVAGIIKWIQKPNDPFNSLALAATVGVLISVPFVPPTDAYRVRLYAATIVAFGLLPVMGIGFIINLYKINLFSSPQLYTQNENSTALYSFLMIIAVLVSPLISKGIAPVPTLPESNCPTNLESTTIHFDKGTYVSVIRESVYQLDWMPSFHQGVFKRSIHRLADNNLIRYLDELNIPVTMLYSLDYQSNEGVLLIIPTDQLPPFNEYVTFCGHWNSDPDLAMYNIFKAETNTK